MIKKLLFFVSVTSLIILAGCAKYKPSPTPFPTGKKQELNNIKVVTRKISPQEVKICFDSTNLAKKYDAVQVYIKNNSTKSIILNSQNISLPILSAKEVCKPAYRCTGLRAGSYGIVAMLLCPFWIPAIIDGLKSSKANAEIDRDVQTKVLSKNDNVIIKPHNHINKITFIPKGQATNEFSIKLVDKNLKTANKFVCNV